MGRAKILENLGEALYRIKPLYQLERLRQRRDDARYRKDKFEVRLTEKFAELTTLEDEIESEKQKLNVLIEEHNSTDKDLTQEIQDQEEVLADLHVQLYRLKVNIRHLRTNVYSLEALIRRLNAVESHLESQEFETYCTDYSPELTGKVATLEINGEPDKIMMLAPASRVYGENISSGELMPVPSMSAAQAAYNFGIHPGWQKWRPTYRAGKIQGIKGENLASVQLLEANSRYQSLDINQGETDVLSDVPIQYMDCMGSVFLTGDPVVVEFQNQEWSQPRVIGFYGKPRRCGLCLSIKINGHAPTRSHRIGLFDVSSGELLEEVHSDQNGVAYAIWPINYYKLNRLVPGIFYEGGDLFAHFMEDSDGFFFRSGYEAYTSDHNIPDEYLEDGEYWYQWSAGRGDTAPSSTAENAETLYLTQVEWFLHTKTLADMEHRDVSRYNDDSYQAIHIEFNGLKKPYATAATRHGNASASELPLINFRDWYHELSGCGDMLREFWDASHGTETKIVFDRGSEVTINNQLSRGRLDKSAVHLGPMAFGDTYRVTFQDSETFLIVGEHTDTYLGMDWNIRKWGSIHQLCEIHRPIASGRSPILSIAPEGWSGTFLEGDVIFIKVSLGKYVLYHGSKKHVATTEEEVHISDDLYEFDLERPAWAGVFYKDDMFFKRQDWQSGTVGPYCDPLSGEQVISEIGPYGGRWRETGETEEEEKALNEFQGGYIPRVQELDGYNPNLYVSAQDYDFYYSTRYIVPLTASRDESPTMEGATVRLKVQATQDSDGNWCGQFRNLDRIEFELRDTPPEYI